MSDQALCLRHTRPPRFPPVVLSSPSSFPPPPSTSDSHRGLTSARFAARFAARSVSSMTSTNPFWDSCNAAPLPSTADNVDYDDGDDNPHGADDDRFPETQSSSGLSGRVIAGGAPQYTPARRRRTITPGSILAACLVGLLVALSLSPGRPAPECTVPGDAVLVHVCTTAPEPLPLHLELIALADLEIDIWQELLVAVHVADSSAADVLPDPVPVLDQLGVLVSFLMDGLFRLPYKKRPAFEFFPYSPFRRALDEAEDMLYDASFVVRQYYGMGVEGWLEYVELKLERLMSLAEGMGEDAYSVLAVQKVPLVVLTDELGPPTWHLVASKEEVPRGEWLVMLQQNLTLVVEGLDQLIDAAECGTVNLRAHEPSSTPPWWPLPRRLWPWSGENQPSEAELELCRKVESLITPRLDFIRGLLERMPGVLEKHARAEAALLALRANTCELLVGEAACIDPRMFDKLSDFFLGPAKEWWYGPDWVRPLHVPAPVLSPEYNEAWYGDFKVLLSEPDSIISGEAHEGHLDEMKEEANRTDWWRHRKTVGCVKTQYQVPQAETMLLEFMEAKRPVVDRQNRLREWLTALDQRRRWLSYNAWKNRWKRA